jgi:hypothetical protein
LLLSGAAPIVPNSDEEEDGDWQMDADDFRDYLEQDRGGSAVGSTLRSGAQGPGFKPALFHDTHDVPVLCQLAV